jgi:U32 family peptidase
MKKGKIQLFAPAGSFEALVAAISNGADAVYLGTKLFNARRLAGNFSQKELVKVVQYAHFHNVKIYLTLNTLIKNKEINAFLNQISLAYKAGVDGIILQDLSFAPLIKKTYPDLEIHASTQSTIMNIDSINYWKKWVDVFVLARELSKEEIKEIYEKTKTKIEIFVHGHLCSSYSGQCLVSSLIGDRSGNRGMCASSCRRQYNGNEYLLSAKDLCLISNISDLVECGATAIKIEGRMKSPEYVATTTREYRKQIDAYYGEKEMKISDKSLNDLKMAFNRNFTAGYFGGMKNIIDPTIPSKRGILLGKVKKGYVKLLHRVEQFDGVTAVLDGEKKGGFVSKILLENDESIKKAKVGDVVKLFIPGFENKSLLFLSSKHGGRNLLGEKKITEIEIDIKISNGKKPKVEISVEDKKLKLEVDFIASTPKKHPLKKEEIEKLFFNIKSKIFKLNKITTNTDSSFVPKSELTKLRDSIEEKLLNLLVVNEREEKEMILPEFEIKKADKKQLHVLVYSFDDVKEAIEGGADIIYYDVFSKDFTKVREFCLGKIEFYAHTPMVLTTNNCKKLKEIVTKNKPDGVLANNVGVLNLNLNCPIRLGYQMNIFNDNQLSFYNKQSIASLELNAKELGQFKNKKDLIYYAQGRPVVMTFKENIGAKSLKDKKEYTFYLRSSSVDVTEMLYSKKIGLLQNTPQILSQGITQLFLDLDREVFKYVNAYKKLLAGENVYVHDLKRDSTTGNLIKGVM